MDSSQDDFVSAFLISCLQFYFSRVCGKKWSDDFDFQTLLNGIFLTLRKSLGTGIGLQKKSVFWYIYYHGSVIGKVYLGARCEKLTVSGKEISADSWLLSIY